MTHRGRPLFKSEITVEASWPRPRALLAVPAAGARATHRLAGAALAVCALVMGIINDSFLDAPRRVECAEHGVVVEHIPWSDGKRPVTCAMMGFLARWARRLSWRETAQVFQTSWRRYIGRSNGSCSGASTSNFPLGPGNMYTPNGGLFTATNFRLTDYLAFAYRRLRVSRFKPRYLDCQGGLLRIGSTSRHGQKAIRPRISFA